MQESCKQCGTCCRKGGPAFHKDDKPLLTSGRVSMSDVYTIREGEPIWDNVHQRFDVAETDIIKIRGNGRSWTCRFLNETDNSCLIYGAHPLECRALKCWNTSDIEAIYAVDRLTREDLLSEVEGLWELIQDHQRECSYHEIRKLLDAGNGELTGSAEARVLEMIRFDASIRPKMVEKGQLRSEMIDFLLGRPLIEIISLFGIEVVRDGDRLCFRKKNHR